MGHIQICKGCLAIDAMWLVEAGVVSWSNYRTLVGRQDIRIVRRGCRSTQALVDYESMPARYKRKIKAMMGDPYQKMHLSVLDGWLQASDEAGEFFENYKTAAGKHLPSEVERQYYAEACVLDAIRRYLAAQTTRRRAMGHRPRNAWDDIAESISMMDQQAWPHKLPTNVRSLQRKYQRFCTEGLESLVHNNYKGTLANSARLRTDEERALLFTLVSDPRNINDEMVAQLYNLNRAEGSAEITARVVSSFREKHEQEIYARRHGATNFRANRLMTVQRTAPTAPLYLWTLDGWDAELLYQKTTTKNGKTVTTYHNRLTLEVVLDACTKYPIGYAIADNESPALIRMALKDALNHVRTLFGSRYKPQQIQMDHAGWKTLKETYEATAKYVTPAAVRNAKAKIIEPWFKFFNDRYCHLQTNWSGYGLTSKKENQPNVEYINRFRKDFPDREGCIAQLEKFIEMERARLHDEYMAKWLDMPEENRLPMSEAQFLMAYGETDGRTRLLQNSGIQLTIDGRRRQYDCFDHDFRRHSSTQWILLFDRDDTSRVLATNEDGSLRFMLEEKYTQPMALIERGEGDSEALQRVLGFNRAEEQRISNVYANMIDESKPLKLAYEEDVKSIAERDYETLSKIPIVDSEGQHKSQKAAARIAAAGDAEDVGDLY